MPPEYQPEHLLGSLLELRDTQRFEAMVSRYIKEEGWAYVVEILRRGRELEEIVPGWNTPLREGILREGLLELLKLKHFEGLDADILDTFANLNADDLDDLRSQAQDLGVELLNKQIKNGNTFFMDLEEMKETELAVIVPDALAARTREIEGLNKSPHLYEVYSTYYGFTVLTSGSVNIKEAGVPDEIREKLLNILGEMSEVTELKSKQLKFSHLAFRNCSPILTVLLWNMLRLSLGGQKFKLKALKKLSELGDSRALYLLYSAYETLPVPRVYTRKCICEIGHPKSYDFFEDHILTSLERVDILEMAGSIRHPAIIEKIENKVKDLHRFQESWQLIPVINAAGNTRLRKWIPFYQELAEATSRKKVRTAVDNALSNVHPPFDETNSV